MQPRPLHRQPIAFPLVASLIALAALLISPSDAHSGQPTPPNSDRAFVLRVPFEDREHLTSLIGKFDVWEVHYTEEGDGGYIIALVPQTEQAWLAAAGYTASVDPRSFHPNTIPDYPCYRTIDELYADLQSVHADHPTITELIDIGDSYQGRDIWVIRITNQALTADKPTFFLMANLHGRELITNETAMVFVDYMTDNYGVDADVTWLVNHHEIHVAVSTNPDGHVKNEPGEPWAWWRKNVNSTFCTGGDEGVDLNRNFAFGWNACPPSWGCSSGDQCYPTYRGPTAASEVETQVVQDYVRTLFADQRDDPITATAPLTTTGVLISLHSFSNLVIWPWGMTTATPPNASGLSTLGEKMATYNGYLAKQAADLYPADGITDDWAYGELGIAAFTFEMGGPSDGFYPPCSRYDALIQPNIPAFLYAAKVARTPYTTSHGPDAAVLVTADSAIVRPGTSVTVTALITDTNNGGDTIAAAEFYVDTPPWAGGTPTPMAAGDGAFDEIEEIAMATLDTSSLTLGRHILFVRGQDASGTWGPFTAAWLDLGAGIYLPLVMQE